MGNIGSSGVNNRRRPSGNVSGRRIHPPPPPPVMPQPEITSNRFMYPAAASATPYQNYPGYYPPPPPTMPLPAPYDHHHLQVMDPMWGRYPQLPPPPPPAPYVEHQKTVTIKNDINIKKETLRIESDEENPGRFLVSLTFDATIDGRVQFPLTIRGVRLNSEVNCC